MFSRIHGNFIAIVAFVLWGLLPLYFQFLPLADTNELLAMRIIFSVPLMLLILKCFKISNLTISMAMKYKKALCLCFLAGLFNCVSLYTFTWAITHDQVLAASLGYFINPLFSVALGIVFFKDKLSWAQQIAVILAAFGIGYQVYAYGELPWVSLVMGCSFALYGLTKKFIQFDSLTSMSIEVTLLMPFALGYMLLSFLSQTSTVFSSDFSTAVLYAGAAPITLIPLVLFAVAVKKTTLTMIGLTQYIEPSLQFLLAIFVFHEVLDQVKLVSFSFIWLGLLLCTLEALILSKRVFHRA
ncbi:EamA family transporter RarD [Photobacterium indicum]|uniref:EamA family transporter RarD n=1 Tax=Photobacterium indicum TaxID=81447 RepID=A0A2T3LCI5_9GAMM|nr:EamA family transporter RarD [Photobacterium indicum]PSV49101.1 EamA family transporter RarD [Photobacterium indicum]